MDSIVMLMSCRSITYDEEHFNKTIPSATAKYAVLVRNVEYSHVKSKQKVLDGLCMSVPQGAIYGLTGSSGCGKTTLISCILGTRTVDTGDIFLYGCNNKNPNRELLVDIPGKGVGFMPQEISLYSKFTIFEILMYFGRLYGMSSSDMVETAKKLLELLQLPRRSTPIELLSGGEKRRVSFAVSLIHSPKLLVLDEPTVGMDPLLRIRIWDHLRSLVKERQVTVIITSHYLDEMRMADKIGIMRDGRIIAENSPQAYLSLCNASSLDEVVLTLCKNMDLVQAQNCVANKESQIDCKDPSFSTFKKGHKVRLSKLRESFFRTRAVIGKNIYTLLRNIPLLLFVMCIPASQLLIILFIGYEPTQLRLGVVNMELSSFGNRGNDSFPSVQTCPDYPETKLNNCDLEVLSCRYLSHISTRKIVLVNFKSEEDAILAVENGRTYGYISFGGNFSTSLVDRALTPNEVNGTLDVDLFDGYQITVKFDQSNTIIYRLLLYELYQSQEAFLISLLTSCGAKREFGEYPLQYRTPVFGVAGDFSFSDYVAPGATIPFMFFFSIISSGLRFVEERNGGTLERMFISGVKLSEIMISFLVSEFFIIVVQAALIFALLSWWMPMHSVESLGVYFAFLLMVLAGYAGVSVGFLLGSVCTEKIQVAIIAIAFVLPNIILSGIIWPLEGMSVVMQTIVQLLPCNLSSQAVSNIWSRGLDMTHPNVWPGAIVLLSYILILNFLTIIYQASVKK